MKSFRDNKTSLWRRLLRSKLMLGANLLLIGLVARSLAVEVAHGKKVKGDLNDLQKRIAQVQGQNKDYSELLSRLDTPGFVDREARLKLGYQKPGEQVLMLKDAVSSSDAVSSAEGNLSKLSNPQKWWRYFFGVK